LTVKSVIPKLGEVVEFESNYDRYRPKGKGGWREDPSEEGNGILLDLGSHLVDQAVSLFGVPKSVTGIVEKTRGLPTDDFFVVTLQYPNGRPLVTCRSGVFYVKARPRFLVHGTTGAFIKSGLDVQEEQLKAGRTPTDGKQPEFGIEPESLWGDLHDGAGISAKVKS